MAGLRPLTVALACTTGLATVSAVSETHGKQKSQRVAVAELGVAGQVALAHQVLLEEAA